MSRARFRFGDFFPEGDILGRFVLTLAMIANDYGDLARLHPDEGSGQQGFLSTRYRTAEFYEIAKFIKRARQLPEVAAFIESLPDDARSAPDAIEDVARQLEPWLSDHRNITFHYPEMIAARIQAEQDVVMNALGAVADLEATLDGEEGRWPFADIVVAELLGDEFSKAAELLPGALKIAAGFCVSSITSYVAAHPAAFVFVDEG